MVTLAPEAPGASEVIAALWNAGVVVSLGHSTATYDEALAAFDLGVTSVTHAFNAMEPTTGRAPGAVIAAIQDARITVGLILDGWHLHPAIVRAAWTLAAGRIALVTDSTAAAGLDSGKYVLGDIPVVVEGGAVRNAQGVLAGSALTLDQALRNLVDITGCTLTEAIASVTSVPAALLGLRRPEISPGATADLVLLDKNLNVVATWVSGDLAFSDRGQP